MVKSKRAATSPAPTSSKGWKRTKGEKSSDSWVSLSKGRTTSTAVKGPPGPMMTVLEHIGNTPLVRCQKLEKEYGLSCELYAKCEFYNAGGSVKDRIGRRMVEDAEASGRLKPGDTIIEPTSGNTGIGLALASAIKGYKCIICLPEKMSNEKVYVLQALGAQIYRTPTEAAWDAPDSHISLAKRLNAEIPNSHILDQYANPGNPLAHYDGTAEEILEQTGGQVDMFVAGAGTGGTISGTAKKLKERLGDACTVVGVDPKGSILAVPDSLNDENRLGSYTVEGIGYDFIPDVLDRELIDIWAKSDDKASMLMMRKMIRTEGLLCGGSCGAAMSEAVKHAKTLKEGQKCVVILPDSVRNYMTKALSDNWMIDQGFIDNDLIQKKEFTGWWATKRVSDLEIKTPLTITSDVTVRGAVDLLKNEGFDMVPVVNNKGDVIGVVTEGNMTARLLSGRCSPDSEVSECLYKSFQKVKLGDTLGALAGIFDHEPFALVCTDQRLFSADSVGGGKSCKTKTVVSGIVSRIDLLDFISAEDTPGSPMKK
ncbi:hypothetical protein TrST_g3679 [Triparma strigata]|uniref:Cystathionine beta-synthase n=1 Tax=Triparma strigata TaxID=1606541 RepID=A0A9W7ET55_9STRA|nr:hypothetical protein TrST_g3679 [Triparma strigata]|mmetsp:Transcript_26599/g.50402  ORF Transcript_26599/g.50402 Transcript_26599/m.50402 type:complete len:539 (+) Transcript_26599:31-1647(+)|eukprot:CAMPEP_0182499426 /NCGR_PEP_ID=MMETSP1321-20130603/7654_1 /TAXON_ID=91990 /ORGANISM="Bolidomonas sp., Strain RCC1657" /LENGTH=538 /DNA_ID=CAMNT_0024703627 /DNA_START=31 /DNA_END=1647 /DNA_ORIENTATION=-